MSLQSRQVYIRSLRHNPKSPPFLSDFGSHKTNSTSSICNSEREIVGKSSLTQEWSSLPNVLTRPALIWSSVLADLAVTLCTMPFFALASSLALAEGDVVERSQWSTFQDHTKVAATIFPIVFAAIIGRLVTKAASWRLERGSTLGILEQLMKSKTVLSTLSTQFELRAFNAVGICLALLWALSPIGGQAALRIIETDFKQVFNTSETTYFDTETPGNFLGLGGATTITSDPFVLSARFRMINTMYSASIMAPPSTKLHEMDLWGNVKIPYLSSYANNDESDWITKPPSESNNVTVYSSLVGIPIYHLPEGNSSFSIESSYIELKCSNFSNLVRVRPLNDTLLEAASYCGSRYTCPFVANGTFQGYDFLNLTASASCIFESTWTLGINYFVNHTYWATDAFPKHLSNQSGIDTNQATLLFQTRNEIGTLEAWKQTYCNINQVYVESKVNCTSSRSMRKDCSVVAQRKSQRLHAPSTITRLSFPKVFRYVSQRLPGADGGNQILSSPALYHIENITRSIVGNNDYARLDEIPPGEFSQRLGQLLNSYLALSQGGADMTGATNALGTPNLTTTTLITTLEEVYSVSTGWLSMFIFSTSVLFLAAITGVIFSHLTITPEILGSCSLLVRNSKYIDLPLGGGTLDGISFSKEFKDLEIKIGQVDKTVDEVGIVGVDLKEKAKKVKLGRKYY